MAANSAPVRPASCIKVRARDILHEASLVGMHATRYSSLSVVCNDWVYGHQSKSYRLGLDTCPGTMASGYVQCMNYAEGLHFSAFHLFGGTTLHFQKPQTTIIGRRQVGGYPLPHGLFDTHYLSTDQPLLGKSQQLSHLPDEKASLSPIHPIPQEKNKDTDQKLEV